MEREVSGLPFFLLVGGWSLLGGQREMLPQPPPFAMWPPGGWHSLPTLVLLTEQVAGRRRVQLPWPCPCPPSLPPLLPFLSCLLLWPEEMEWAEGGPVSSHPLPEPKSGATLPPPEPGREEGCAAGEVAGTTARNQDPPPSSQGP